MSSLTTEEAAMYHWASHPLGNDENTRAKASWQSAPMAALAALANNRTICRGCYL